MKPLEEMNLVDDFLAHSLASHKIYGEEASRFILECILQRRVQHLTVVSRKTWYGEASQGHGVRLDLYLDEEDGEIFDMEPDNNGRAGDVAALPRRVRFYHSKIDAGNLAAGEDYKALRNVVVIFIATYDPFGSKRMVYTIKTAVRRSQACPMRTEPGRFFCIPEERKGGRRRGCGSLPGIWSTPRERTHRPQNWQGCMRW